MRLVVANDSGRIRKHPDLNARFLPLGAMTADQPDHFIEKIGALHDDCVLFWHEAVVPALNCLSTLHSDQKWPVRLRGVVLFGGAPFASMSSKIEADEAIRASGVDVRAVCVLADAVRFDGPRDLLAGRIAEFDRAVRNPGWKDIPFDRLAIPGQSDGVLTLLVIQRAISRDAGCWPVFRREADWLQIQSELRQLGITIQVPPTVASVHRAAADLRGSSDPTGLCCRNCTGRYALFHDAEKIHTRDDPKAELRRIASSALPLIDHARAHPEEMKQSLELRLKVSQTPDVRALLKEVLTELLEGRCRLAGTSQNLRDIIGEISRKPVMAEDIDAVQASVKTALACDFETGVEL